MMENIFDVKIGGHKFKVSQYKSPNNQDNYSYRVFVSDLNKKFDIPDLEGLTDLVLCNVEEISMRELKMITLSHIIREYDRYSKVAIYLSKLLKNERR